MMWRILAIGRYGDSLPDHPDIQWSDDPRAPHDAAVLFEAATLPPELSALTPLASFGFAPTLLPDFAAPQPTPDQLDAMLAAFEPVRTRLDEIDAVADTPELSILRLGYSRAQPFDALLSPAAATTVIYPLLQGRVGIEAGTLRPMLESLAGMDLLERRFAARVLCCPTCHGGRLNAFEACTACGSANLFEEPIVHHYRCGFQDGESRFVSGLDLICPKCQQELRHFGVDYGRPGTMIRCRACQQVMSEPQPSFHCLDCATVSRGEHAMAVDWFHYTLTERGIAAARDGDLPQLDIASLIRAMPRTMPLKDFVLLVREQLLVAKRYDRAMTLGRIHIGNLASLRRVSGVAAVNAALRLFSQILVENLRETDFAAVPRDDLLLIALPETPIGEARQIFDRIAKAAGDTLVHDLALRFEAVAAAQAGELLEELAA